MKPYFIHFLSVLFCLTILLSFTACGEKSEYDIDLTQLTPILAYAQAQTINDAPQKYKGQSIHVNGIFATGYDRLTQKDLFFILVGLDSTGCCREDIEFIWTGHDMLSDYPSANTPITLTGIFSSYTALGQTYYYIKADKMTVR